MPFLHPIPARWADVPLPPPPPVAPGDSPAPQPGRALPNRPRPERRLSAALGLSLLTLAAAGCGDLPYEGDGIVRMGIEANRTPVGEEDEPPLIASFEPPPELIEVPDRPSIDNDARDPTHGFGGMPIDGVTCGGVGVIQPEQADDGFRGAFIELGRVGSATPCGDAQPGIAMPVEVPADGVYTARAVDIDGVALTFVRDCAAIDHAELACIPPKGDDPGVLSVEAKADEQLWVIARGLAGPVEGFDLSITYTDKAAAPSIRDLRAVRDDDSTWIEAEVGDRNSDLDRLVVRYVDVFGEQLGPISDITDALDGHDWEQAWVEVELDPAPEGTHRVVLTATDGLGLETRRSVWLTEPPPPAVPLGGACEPDTERDRCVAGTSCVALPAGGRCLPDRRGLELD